MQPNEFFTVALDLAKNSPSAAEKRTAVSRAYYASHHTGANIIQNLGGRVGRGSSAHGNVFGSLCGCSVKDVAKLGEKIKSLHGWRRRADYILTDTLVEKDSNVQQVLLDATEIINKLEDICLHSSDKNRTQEDILQYLQENT